MQNTFSNSKTMRFLRLAAASLCVALPVGATIVAASNTTTAHNLGNYLASKNYALSIFRVQTTGLVTPKQATAQESADRSRADDRQRRRFKDATVICGAMSECNNGIPMPKGTLVRVNDIKRSGWAAIEVIGGTGKPVRGYVKTIDLN